jgi:hypothetical protein
LIEKSVLPNIPEGDVDDHTRIPDFYDHTFNYLKDIGIAVI